MESNTIENVQDYLLREKVINCLMSRQCYSQSIRNLIYSIYGTDEEAEDFIFTCSSDDINTILRANGINIEEMNERFMKRIKELKDTLSSNVDK